MISIFVYTSLLLITGIYCSPAPQKTSEPENNAQLIQGKIVFVDLEGGFFAIIAEDGSRYNPVNLPEKFRKDGLRIRFRGSPDRKSSSIQMWGILYRIHEIELVEPQN